MLPPSPPSPPLGPPRGTNFSRRKAIQPCPPSPALTVILASSINMVDAVEQNPERSERAREPIASLRVLLFGGLDADEAAGAAFVFVLNDAGDLREEGVISADADINARLELRAALTNEDRAARHELATKS